MASKKTKNKHNLELQMGEVQFNTFEQIWSVFVYFLFCVID